MKVVFIGSGNVATHMANAFKAAGHDLVQVWSNTFSNAEILASQIDAKAICRFEELDRNADVYIIAVKDSAISAVITELNGINGLVLHTSGATPITVLKGFTNHGVIYPLQTFSKGTALDFKLVPLCIEAGDWAALTSLKSIAQSLSEKVYEINSDSREMLHLAAVFACNFVNQLYTLSSELLQMNNLEFDMLRPLILETANKVQTAMPAQVQTGPAVRKDELTIRAHLKLLHHEPELNGIYQTLSDSIKKTHQ